MARKKTDNAFRLIQLVGDYPTPLYRLPTDGRKWQAVCEKRAVLMSKLARFGDPDGTQIRPSITNNVLEKTGWSLRNIWRLLDSLVEHGVLINEPHYHGEGGPRVRRLDVKVLEFWYPAKGYPQIPQRPAGVPDTKNLAKAGVPNTEQECQIAQEAAAGVPNSKSGSATYGGTQPPADPPKTPPPPPPGDPTAVAGGQAGAVLLDLQRAYQQSIGKVLVVGKAKTKLSAMIELYSPATVASAVEKWDATRVQPAATLRQPAEFLLTELPLVLEQVDADAKAAAKLAAVMPGLQARATEMTEQYWAWAKRLEEFGDAATAKYLACENPPANSVIDDAVDAWVAANPPPTNGPWEVNQAGQLFSVDNVNDMVQAAKMNISMATEQMGAEQTTE